MFWKIGRFFNLSSLSLVNRLTLFYSLTSIGITSLAVCILLPALERINHAHEIDYQDHFYSSCMQRLELSLIISIILAIIFGKIIARKSIRYIREFSDKMQAVTVSSLTEKFNPYDMPIELRPLAESYNIMLAKLQKAFAQMTQFSANIAHELRTPIHNLIGINELALINSYPQEKQQAIFESNMEECQHILKLIESLLFLAQVDHGKSEVKKNILQSQTEIKKILDYYEPIILENNIRIHCDGDALLQADSTLFKRAISNIITNSLHYTPRNGEIFIQVSATADHICISIRDTGIGIEEKHIDKVFDRFFRVDSSRSSKTGGIGLGLSIVKSIMELHGGKVALNSQSKIGTTILMYFPV
jgi:two-component system, OmpR family, heavy metal sensor histidine kinase CusS